MIRIYSILRTWVLLFAVCMGSLSYAQSAREYLSVDKAPSWVVFQAVPEAKFDLGNENTKIYKLVDWQIKVDVKTRARYKHYATALLSAEAVQDNSSIEITFDPSFQSVVLHHLTIIRDGKRFNRLDLKGFKLFSVETDEDRLIYNGSKRASLIIPDVRVGDTIDYAYTILGANPAFGSNFSYYAQLEYSAPVQKIHERVLVDRGIATYTKAYANAPKPVIGRIGNYTSYIWEIDNSPQKDADDNQPNWYYGYQGYRFSSYENWDAVGQYFNQYYMTPRTLPRELRPVVANIQKKYLSKERRARAALAYVQKEIRYLGIEIGSGGYIPRPPKLVLKRRFGDCKDMTLLLLTLLKELDIEAHAILVNSDTRGGVTNELARATAFDHVLVRANLEGTYYYLDATRGEQLGNIQHFEQGWYEKGVIIASDSPGLVAVNIEGPQWWKVIEDRYDLVSDPDKVLLKTTSSYYGFQSDSMLSWYKREGREGVAKSFLEYFQNTYPTIEQTKPFEVEIFDDEAIIHFTGYYEIQDAWEENTESKVKYFSAYASDLDADFPEFVGAKRTTPYTFTHPIRTKQVLSFQLDDSWVLEDESEIVKNSAFDFAKVSVFKGDVYSQTYTYRTKSDHIMPSEYDSIMGEIKKIDNDLGVELQYGTDIFSKMSESDYEKIMYAMIGIAFIIAFVIVIINRNKDVELRWQLVFYPVSMKKFLLLSFISLGIYQYYWIYKNWLWLKTVQEEDVSPFWRTIFAQIMNFSLFGYIANHDREGYRWFLIASIPIAILFFLANVLDRAVNRIETLPDWLTILSLLTVLVLAPVAMQVNKMNDDRSELIAENSRFTWHTYGFIALFTPIFLLVMAGMLIIIFEMF